MHQPGSNPVTLDSSSHLELLAPSAKIQKIDSLTGLRFYAAFLVFVSHMYHFQFFHINNETLVLILSQLGHLGVSIFFVLSGFVLFMNYYRDNSTKVDAKRFYVARFARIYPVFLVTTLMALPMEVFSKTKNFFWESLGMNVSLTQCLLPMTCGSFNDVSWSVAIEAFFYLTFPSLLLLFAKPKRLVVALVLMVCYVITVNQWDQGNFYTGHRFPVNRTVEFFTGMIGAWFFMHRCQFKNSTLPSIFRLNIICLLLSAIILVSMPVLLTLFHLPRQLDFLFYTPFSILIILSLSTLERKGLALSGVTAKWAIYLGEISYSFYLIHNLILRYLEHGSKLVFHWDIKTLALPIQMTLALLCLGLSIFASHLLFHYIESPFREKIKKYCRTS